MAQYVVQYVEPLLRRQASVLRDKLGVDIMGVDAQSYRLNLTVLVLIGVVMKAMVDKGAITDAEWLARVDSSLDPVEAWPYWIVAQAPPGTPAPEAGAGVNLGVNVGINLGLGGKS